jgi:RNA polymerase sigma-70 factor, ECF subfamily
MPHPNRHHEFVGLIGAYTNQIFTYVHALLLNWNDAEDVFQEVCVVLWKKFEEYQPGTNFLGWALRIAQHKAMDFQKMKSRRVAFHASLRDSLLSEVAHRDDKTSNDNLSALSDCVATLAAADRDLVRACYGEGVPVSQVAGGLGRTPQSVHNSLARIRNALIECIHRRVRRTASDPQSALTTNGYRS